MNSEPRHIVLVEDDAVLAETLSELLRGDGYRLTHFDHGSEAMALLSRPAHEAHLVLLDLNLPGYGGLEILDALRRHDRETPVLILTARGAVEDRVSGLDLGADDYLAKPFALSELEARVRALLRRQSQPHGLLMLGPLALDPTSLSFTLDNQPLALPPREQRVLACLLRHAGQPVEKSRLVVEAFNEANIGDNAIEVYIHRLRKRLPAPLKLLTVRGLGYLLDVDK
ncbi:response regulator [Halomonas alkaliantarctica]|nr:response regulator [Halomonas alkaliantarctica]